MPSVSDSDSDFRYYVLLYVFILLSSCVSLFISCGLSTLVSLILFNVPVIDLLVWKSVHLTHSLSVCLSACPGLWRRARVLQREQEASRGGGYRRISMLAPTAGVAAELQRGGPVTPKGEVLPGNKHTSPLGSFLGSVQRLILLLLLLLLLNQFELYTIS